MARWGLRPLQIAAVISILGFTSEKPLPGQVQEQEEPETRVEVYVSMDQIQVHFLVRDPEGDLIRNLSSEDFEVFENGETQEIVSVQQEEVPISAVVMVDTSGSLNMYLENALSTAVDFFGGLEHERAAFVLFSDEPRVIVNWGEEAASDVSGYLTGVRAGGMTAMYDSVIWVAETLFQDIAGKKLIILITDAIDTASTATLEDMMSATREGGITLYSVVNSNTILANYRQRLNQRDFTRPDYISLFFHDTMVQRTQFVNEIMRFGGRTVFSVRFADLEEIYTDIIVEMRNYYVLLYKSDYYYFEDREIRIVTHTKTGKIFIEISQ